MTDAITRFEVETIHLTSGGDPMLSQARWVCRAII